MSSVLLIAAITGLLVLGAVVVWFRRRYRQRRREDFREHERKLEELRREHTNRVERLRRERDRARETGHIDFVASLLPALDALRRAQRELDDPPESVEPLVDGLDMAQDEIEATLRSYDIERIEPPPSEPFDPELHEALRAVDDADTAPGTVLECHRPGYRFGDRTLRPASVAVSVAAEDDETDEPSRGGAEEKAGAATNRADAADDRAPGASLEEPEPKPARDSSTAAED